MSDLKCICDVLAENTIKTDTFAEKRKPVSFLSQCWPKLNLEMVLYLGVFSLFKGAVGYKMDRKLVTCKFKHFLTLTESNAFTALTVFRADQLSLP